MAPFRLGLIGAGRMGRTHLRALAGSERVAVTAIAEMSAAARAACAAPGVSVHASVEEMLEAASLDGVLIVAPTDQHGAIIAEVAARGLPILCEKPCGLTAQPMNARIKGRITALQRINRQRAAHERRSKYTLNLHEARKRERG